VADIFILIEGNMMKTANDRSHHILGVLEHGMYSKRICERGRSRYDLHGRSTQGQV